MAYMTVRLSAGAYSPATNSTPVSATVSITWDTAQSYDQTNGTGTLTIGSYSATFGTNFNESRTQSGTKVLGSFSTTIYHNSNGDPVQVVASASSSRYNASDILTLSGGTPSSGSGGNTGDGDDSGNTGGGNTGGNTGGGDDSGVGSDDEVLPRSYVTFSSSGYVTLTVWIYDPSTGSQRKMSNGTSLTVGTSLLLEYVRGLPLDECEVVSTVNGVPFNSGDIYTITSEGTTYIYVAVTEKDESGDSGESGGDSGDTNFTGVFYIDMGTELVAYRAFIDNGTSWEEIGKSGVEAQRKEGTVTYRGSRLFVDCGFAPDSVVFEDPGLNTNTQYGRSHPTFVFNEWNDTQLVSPYFTSTGLIMYGVSRVSTGFYIEGVYTLGADGSLTPRSNTSIKYVANKYT